MYLSKLLYSGCTSCILQAYKELPGAKGVTFKDVPVAETSSLLPNLPAPSEARCLPVSHFQPDMMSPSALDLLLRFLVYPPERRLKAHQALRHPWFSIGPLLLPVQYMLCDEGLHEHVTSTWEGQSLGDAIQFVLAVCRKQ